MSFVISLFRFVFPMLNPNILIGLTTIDIVSIFTLYMVHCSSFVPLSFTLFQILFLYSSTGNTITKSKSDTSHLN